MPIPPFWLILVCLATVFTAAALAEAPSSVAIAVDVGPRTTLTHARSVGLNLEMALTSDRMWQADGRWMARTFQELGITTLRWGYSAIWWDAFAEKPLTDNYWSANNSPDAAGSFGLKEFVDYCKATHTTPSIMLPVDALAAGVPIEKVVDLSRRIASYVHAQNLNTLIYLEMGNEPYSKPVLPPERYAKALRTLYPIVKAIDSRFRVVAHINREFQPFITEPCVDFYDVLQWHHYLTCGGKGNDPWQWYYGHDSDDLVNLSHDGFDPVIPPGKGYVIGETNVLWPDWFAPMAGDLRSSLAYLDLLLSTINANGADAILPWPSHWPAHKGGTAYGLFNYDAFTSQGRTDVFPAVAGVHRILRDAVLEQSVPARSADPKVRIFAYGSPDGTQLNFVFINKRPTSGVLRVPFAGKLAKAQAFGLYAASPGSTDNANYSPLSPIKIDADTVTFTAPPESAVLLQLTLRP